MSHLGEALQQRWLGQGIKLRPGASEDQVVAFEKMHNVIIPADMRQYLTTSDGFDGAEHWMTDDDLITFLALDEIQPLNEYWNPKTPGGSSYFVFADYSLSVHVYAIKLVRDSSEPNDVVVVGDIRPQKIANCFSDFAQAYLDGKSAVLFPRPAIGEDVQI